mgnify:CR=1 FL=1
MAQAMDQVVSGIKIFDVVNRPRFFVSEEDRFLFDSERKTLVRQLVRMEYGLHLLRVGFFNLKCMDSKVQKAWADENAPSFVSSEAIWSSATVASLKKDHVLSLKQIEYAKANYRLEMRKRKLRLKGGDKIPPPTVVIVGDEDEDLKILSEADAETWNRLTKAGILSEPMSMEEAGKKLEEMFPKEQK